MSAWLRRGMALGRRAKRTAVGAKAGWTGALPGPLPPTIPPWPLEGPMPSFPDVESQPCTDAQIRTVAYRRWGDRLKVREVFVHRKQWEWFYIGQALEESGVIVPGARGLGFGVGQEPLASWFALQGCTIVATDYPGGEHADSWASTGELAKSLTDLNSDGICPDDVFAERVSFRRVDMREIPDDLRDFDFTWSSCAFEHLGTIEEGLRFVKEQLRTLKPGGVAVHTTELNVSSATETIEAGGTVLFRRSDIERLAAELTADGHEISCTFHTGDYPNDRWVDRPPFSNTHLKVMNQGYAITSYGLLIRKSRKASGPTP